MSARLPRRPREYIDPGDTAAHLGGHPDGVLADAGHDADPARQVDGVHVRYPATSDGRRVYLRDPEVDAAGEVSP